MHALYCSAYAMSHHAQFGENAPEKSQSVRIRIRGVAARPRSVAVRPRNDTTRRAPSVDATLSAMKWLLLRGLAREQRHWGAFPATFKSIVKDAEPFCIDLPGAGTEIHNASPLTMREVMEDVRTRWLSLKGSGNEAWGLVGISFGGMVAQQWGADHPEDFERIVLINTSAANLSVPWKRLDYKQIPGVVGALLERDREKRERKILGMTTRLSKDLDRIASEWGAYQVDRPIPRTTVFRQLFAAVRFRAPQKIATRVLVLSGGGDPFTDPSCPERLANHYRAPLARHPDGGHDLSIDAPEWIAEEVRDWISRTS